MEVKKIIGYFQVDDGWQFALVLKDFWDKNGHLDDSGSEVAFVPEGFYELAEAIYEYGGDSEDGKKVLIAAGWIETKLN